MSVSEVNRAIRELLPVRRARFVGGLHGSAQRERIERAALLGQRLKICQAIGDQAERIDRKADFLALGLEAQ